jgi:hypothetical protein
MGLFDELKKDNKEHAKAINEEIKKDLEVLKEDNSERIIFINKHSVFQSTEINKVFKEAVEDLKNNSRILEQNEVVSEKMLPVSGCHIEYKDSIFLLKVEAHPHAEKVILTITINRKEIAHKQYSIEGFDGKVMADDITQILRDFKK